MAKKTEPIEIEELDDIDVETPPIETTTKKAKAKINIMDPVDSHEAPKSAKTKDDVPLDLGPVLEKIDKGFSELQASLIPKSTPAPKSEPSTQEMGFLTPLGDW